MFKNKFNILIITILAILTVGGFVMLSSWRATSSDTSGRLFTQFSAQNLPRITERKISEKLNVVIADIGQPNDLIDFLTKDYTGCETGYYKILKVVPNRFALMNYGCDGNDNSRSFIIAINLADGWSLISPTNNMSDQGVPSCLLTGIFRVSKTLSSTCYENTGHSDGSLQDVLYP